MHLLSVGFSKSPSHSRISVGRSCSRATRRRGWDARPTASTSALDTRVWCSIGRRGNILFDFGAERLLCATNARPKTFITLAYAGVRDLRLNLNEGPPSLTFEVPWPAAKKFEEHLAQRDRWIAPRRRGLLGDVKRRVGPRPRRGQRRGARRPRQGRLRPRALRRFPARRRKSGVSGAHGVPSSAHKIQEEVFHPSRSPFLRTKTYFLETHE